MGNLPTLLGVTRNARWKTTFNRCRLIWITCWATLRQQKRRPRKPWLMLEGWLIELRAEQDHYTAQEKAVKTTGKVLDDLSHRAEDASIQATLGAQQLPVKLEGRAREIELELTRTVQTTAEFHKTIT